MTEFLRCALHAPMASWGEIAVGEWRGSWDRPGRSAIIGVLGASLGVQRDDSDGQRALTSGYGVAVRADAVGSPMRDYHTMQAVSKPLLKRRVAHTRADVLLERSRETVLSTREYRTDVVCTVVVWAREGARWSLAEVRDAVLTPVFAPFAGRRCNPLGLPMQPDIVSAETLAGAFLDSSQPLREMLPPFTRLRPAHGWGREVAHDQCEGFSPGLLAPFFRMVRRDVPLNRAGWTFEERIVSVGMLPDAEAAR